MKKLIGISTVILALFLIQSFIPSSDLNNSSPVKQETVKKEDFVKYVFCKATEQAKSGGKNQPVVTNVFKFYCSEETIAREYIILDEFNTFYDAFYKQKRNSMYIKDANKFMYDSYNDAEKGRREYIAKYVKSGDSPLLIEKFSVLCAD